MKRYLFLVAFAMFGLVCAANAQDSELPKYQRSSLHMVLLTTDEPNIEGSEDFAAILDQAWQEYPFPEKYNEHKIDVTKVYGGKLKGSFEETINEFLNSFDRLSLDDAKDLVSNLEGDKVYNANLVNTINDVIDKEKMGNQLIRKWFNIQDDGSWNYELIMERAAYNADQADIAEAQVLSRGVQAIFDQGEDLISNTFVTFSKLSFYKNEPVAAFYCNIAKYIASFLPEPGRSIGILAADKTYKTAKDGYTAKTTTALYQLVWNDEVRATFYDMFEGDKINMEKFNAYSFPLTLVGIDKSSGSTVDLLEELGNTIGFDLAQPSESLIKKTIIRNIDKLFAKMQKKHKVLAPVAQIISTDPLIADIGMKEDLEANDKFRLIEPKFDPKTCKFEWHEIGTNILGSDLIKPKKGERIWDNRYSLIDEANGEKPAEEPAIKGTVFTNHKQARRGMLIRQVIEK